MRPLDGKGIDRVAGEVIVPTSEGNLFAVRRPLIKDDRFCQPLLLCPNLVPGVRRIEHPRGKEARAPCDALLAPGARAARR
jgi:hypothetical protein